MDLEQVFQDSLSISKLTCAYFDRKSLCLHSDLTLVDQFSVMEMTRNNYFSKHISKGSQENYRPSKSCFAVVDNKVFVSIQTLCCFISLGL